MNAEFLAVLDHLTREKGIDREVILEAVESALVSAARKAMGPKAVDVEVKIDRTTGSIKIFSDGKEIPDAGFGRIAAQTAKQVIFHKIREAERNVVFNEFSPRAGTLLTGSMHRFERGAVIVELGKTEGIVPKREQSPKESFRPGDRIRAYCLEVNKTAKGPQVILSRSHPNLVKELFKLEVPEIAQGIVEVKSISREAGDRTKIAVHSKEEKVDCVGACVGMRGTRVKDIVRELHGEKIDIIRWSPKLEEYVTAALAPAKVAEIKLSPDKKRAEVLVDDDQLSLAIGKRGQNVRLAAKLTGLDIDIRSKAQAAQLAKINVADLPGVGPKMLEALTAAGFETVAGITQASLEELTQAKGVGEKTAKKLLGGAKELLAQLEKELAAEQQKKEQQQEQPPEQPG
ncbi:MAG: transcription termination/antitermination protein NusA [Candidatus Omnitrophica bacterium]|nr:transcription termination/antitermination protein NusA [Candidatus Omnitrophota bacterium]